MSSLRRPPIEFLFGSLFILFLLFGSCHSKTNRFIGLVTQGHRSFGLGKGARRARRRRNRWRQAMTSLSGDAMPSTEGSAQPSTTLEASSSHPRVPPFGHSRSRVSLVSELLRWSLSGAATVEQPRRSELYQTQPLNLPSRRPAPGRQPIRFWARFEDLGLVSHSLAPWGTNEDFDLSTNRGR